MELLGSICLLLCGVGVFFTGMKLLSDGLKQSSGNGVRVLFKRISDNRFASYGMGIGTTLIVQSSSATIIMSLGLVNASIMTLEQSVGFLLGAHAGTTITGILVSLSSFKITPILMAAALVGICLIMFVRNETVVNIGYILAGFGVLFAGMYLMSNSIENNERITVFFTNMFAAIDFPPLLILVGILFTMIIQSSSAVSGILVAMITAGTLVPGQAIFIFIGATVGTCGDVLLASVAGTTDAKRTAFLNIITTVIGVLTIGNLVWIFKDRILLVLSNLISMKEWQLSLFNVFYSTVTSFLTLFLIKPLTKLSRLLIKDKKSVQSKYHMYYVDELLLENPPIAVMQARKEVENMAKLARENLERGLNALVSQKMNEKDLIIKTENEIDFITRGISEFLVKISSQELGYKDEKLVGSLHHVIDDIERIGDHAEDFMKQGEKMFKENVHFSDKAAEEIEELKSQVLNMYTSATDAFVNNNEKLLHGIKQQKVRIHIEKKRLLDCHVERLVSGLCTIETGSYFYAATSSLERIGEHLENIAFSIRSITGSSSEIYGKKEIIDKV